MKYQIKIIMLIIIANFGFSVYVTSVLAVSDVFPKMTSPPTITISSANNIYYCSPSGDNSRGDGSIENPWLDLIGADSGGTGNPVGPGALIYLRGGRYPSYSYVNFSRSQNILSRSGSSTNPIVITNYPGEIAEWNSVDIIWSLTLNGDHQKLIGTKVNGLYGIKITGGISVRGNYCRVSGLEFIGGTSNGGDLNPAMLSVPLLSGCEGLQISHNYFHDSKYQISQQRMGCVRFFDSNNAIVEFNIFENNLEIDGGVIVFKDSTVNAIVRNNKFINCRFGISYFTQHHSGNQHNGLDVNNNLFYAMRESSFRFQNESGPNIRVYNNVSLAAQGSFFYYLNADPIAFSSTDTGEFYNNIIQGTAFEKGWHTNSSNLNNLPHFFDYNLWYSSSDRNTPSGWSLPSGYHSHAVTSNNAVTYDSNNRTCTVEDNYSAKTSGRNRDCIGGFTFNVETPPSVSNVRVEEVEEAEK